VLPGSWLQASRSSTHPCKWWDDYDDRCEGLSAIDRTAGTPGQPHSLEPTVYQHVVVLYMVVLVMICCKGGRMRIGQDKQARWLLESRDAGWGSEACKRDDLLSRVCLGHFRVNHARFWYRKSHGHK